jgi:hypothetical protein
MYLSIYLSIYLYLSIYPSIYLAIYLFSYLATVLTRQQVIPTSRGALGASEQARLDCASTYSTYAMLNLENRMSRKNRHFYLRTYYWGWY